MNKRLTLKNDLGKTVYCILSGENPPEKELEAVFDIKPGYGFSVSMDNHKVRLVDYFAGETRASFEIISMEDTGEAPLYLLTPV